MRQAARDVLEDLGLAFDDDTDGLIALTETAQFCYELAQTLAPE